MLSSLRKNGLTSLFKEVRVFKDPNLRKIERRADAASQSLPRDKFSLSRLSLQLTSPWYNQEAAKGVDLNGLTMGDKFVTFREPLSVVNTGNFSGWHKPCFW